MKTPRLLTVALALCCAATHAEDALHELQCRKEHAFLAPADSSDYRKYAPSREIDILHLAIDITPDFTNRTVTGKTTITFKPIAKPFDELSLDAVDLAVRSVTSSEAVLDYQVTDEKIVVTFAKPVPPEREAWVAIEHHAEPEQGMYFRTPEMGYLEGDTHLFTQGQPIEARHWYPCFDSPNEKFTSEITCRVPEGMTVLSNGRRVSQQRDPATGLVAIRWLQEQPHVNYLISIVAGYLEKIEDRYGEIPLAFYTPPSSINEATNSFRDTKDMMAFFEKEIGVPYPWPKYYQVVVNDFVAGGMENTSLTTLTDRTLHTPDTENIRSSQSLVAHELAHQWFGDLITCKDWSHLWLNEGFATYYDNLYNAHRNGRDSMLYNLYRQANRILAVTNAARPIVDRKYNTPNSMFTYLAYDKGNWVLHMLRSQLGEDLFRNCVKTLLERHQFGSVVTEDFNRIIEELSGRSFDQFFDQWVYHAHHPELDISYSWDARAGLARVSVRQTQKISNDVLLFNVPLTIRFTSASGTVDRQITVKETSEDFYFALAEAPTAVRIDPDFALLARINFTPPTAMLHAQLAEKSDVVGRILAVETLARRKDKESLTRLKKTLNEDPFYGVRIEAAKALRGIHSDEALDALIASIEQPDARVRRQVYADIASFYHPRAFEAQREMLAREKNPDIQILAIRELGTYAQPGVRDTLLQYLNSTSYRHVLADAAIGAIRAQNDPDYVPHLQENLRQREAEYPGQTFARGLDAIAYLSRDAQNRDGAREFILGYVNHRKRAIQLGAIDALGTLEDPRALHALEKFALARRNSPQLVSAARSIRAINGARRTVDGVADLRKEFLELQKDNRDLRKDFNDLEKKIGALTPKGEPGRKPAPALKSPKSR